MIRKSCIFFQLHREKIFNTCKVVKVYGYLYGEIKRRKKKEDSLNNNQRNILKLLFEIFNNKFFSIKSCWRGGGELR